MKPEMFSLNAAIKIVEHISWVKKNWNSLIKIEGILITMYEPRTKASSQMQDRILNQFARYLFKTIIPKNATLNEATLNGKPAILYNPTSKGAKAYSDLANEIISRTENHI